MGLFGSMGRKRNPWDMGGFGSNGIVATPEQEEETRRLNAMFGIKDDQFEPINPQTPQQAPQEAPQQRQGFWQGGGKFGVKDGLAAALAAVGDAFAQQGGGRGGAVQMLAGGRMDAMEAVRRAQEAQMQRQQGLQDYEAKKKIDQRYAQPDTPAIGKNLDYFMNNIQNDPQRLAAFGQYQDYVNPRWAQGADGRQYPQQRGLPQAPVGRLTPINPGGPAQGGGSMPPDAQTMERLYIESFGEARGRPLFNEWLSLTKGGR